MVFMYFAMAGGFQRVQGWEDWEERGAEGAVECDGGDGVEEGGSGYV